MIGGGLSFVGYNQSLQQVTVTNTRSFLVTSTLTSTSTSSESLTTSTTTLSPILTDQFMLDATGPSHCDTLNNDQITRDHVPVNSGQIHVSFSSSGGPVNFWILSDSQYSAWGNAQTCTARLAIPAVFLRAGTVSFDGIAQIPSTGYYYFVFDNTNQASSVSVSFEADNLIQVKVTVTNYVSSYSTQSTTFPTQQVVSQIQPAGFGSIFYLGLAIAIVGIAACLLSLGKTCSGKRR